MKADVRGAVRSVPDDGPKVPLSGHFQATSGFAPAAITAKGRDAADVHRRSPTIAWAVSAMMGLV